MAVKKAHKREKTTTETREVRARKPRVSKNAPQSPAKIRARAQRKATSAVYAMRVLAVVAIVAVLSVIGYFVAKRTSLFAIERVEAQATEHLSTDDISKLAGLETGTTLLNYDEEAIKESLLKNPWVMNVDVERVFPDALRLTIEERPIKALVLMSTGSLAWYLGEGDIWVEPVTVVAQGEKSVREEALELARARDAILVTDIPTTVEPNAGQIAEEAEIQAISLYRDSFSEEFRNRITSFTAASVESINCTLDNGVEVALGEPEQIPVKEAIVLELLQNYPGELTYINVRVPASPTYRRIGIDYVQLPEEGQLSSEEPSSTSDTSGDS